MKIAPPCLADTLPAEYLQRIGEIIYIWARLEYQLSVIAREGYKVSKETGRAFTIGMELNVLCATLRTATLDDQWIKDAVIRKEIAQLAKDVKDDSDNRHKYAHGICGYFEDKPNEFYRYLMKASPHRIRPSNERITLDSLQKEISDVRALLERSFDLTTRLKASRRKPVGGVQRRL